MKGKYQLREVDYNGRFRVNLPGDQNSERGVGLSVESQWQFSLPKFVFCVE